MYKVEVEPLILNKTMKMVWLEKLLGCSDVNQLASIMQKHNPGINAKNLKQIVIVGSAGEGQRLAEICAANSIKVLAICDDNQQMQGKNCAGHTVVAVNQLKQMAISHDTPVILATHRVLKPYNRLHSLGFTNVAPFAVLQALAPELFVPHMFYENWLEDLFNSRKQVQELAKLLADDMSRHVLDAVLGFRMTLDPTVLEPIVEWELYGPNDLLDYTDEEIYIDGGTFDGDSIKLFINRVANKFRRIIGFEPDTNTYKLLQANFAAEPRVEAVNKGLYSHEAILKFDNAGTRGSILIEDGADNSISVPVTSVDQYLNGDPVTYIKMNIEGAEIAALNGAKDSITKYAPKLAISIYHRPNDLWQIPELVRKLQPKYDLYIRQHDGGVIETVLYALPK